ncbi:MULTISPECIES: hypothetical protein [unclassified Microbacterium]|uniref:hypothetical protein n=1 Tax=unclassified Microbacterium TaxID=2609290 RepID=UPI00300FE9E3
MGEFSTEVRTTQGGVFLERLTPESGEWERGNPTGEKTHVFRLGDHDGLSRADRRELFQPRTRMITVCWNGQPICHRPIRNLSFDITTEKLTVTHEDIRARILRRYLWGVGHMTPQSVFDWRGYSTRGVARQVLYYALVHPYSAAWPLNVDVGGAELGSSPWAQYFAYDGQTAGDILSDIEDIGPDIELEPEFRNGAAWWAARIGTPHLTGPAYELPLRAAPTSGAAPAPGSLVGAQVVHDGSEMATGAFAVGRGSEQDQRIGQAALPETVPVSADYIVPYREIDDQAHLDALALAWVQSHAGPRVQWSTDVLTQDIPPSELRIGSILTALIDQTSPWLDPGIVRRRVIGYSGTTESAQYSLVLEPL